MQITKSLESKLWIDKYCPRNEVLEFYIYFLKSEILINKKHLQDLD